MGGRQSRSAPEGSPPPPNSPVLADQLKYSTSNKKLACSEPLVTIKANLLDDFNNNNFPDVNNNNINNNTSNITTTTTNNNNEPRIEESTAIEISQTTQNNNNNKKSTTLQSLLTMFKKHYAPLQALQQRPSGESAEESLLIYHGQYNKENDDEDGFSPIQRTNSMDQDLSKLDEDQRYIAASSAKDHSTGNSSRRRRTGGSRGRGQNKKSSSSGQSNSSPSRPRRTGPAARSKRRSNANPSSNFRPPGQSKVKENAKAGKEEVGAYRNSYQAQNRPSEMDTFKGNKKLGYEGGEDDNYQYDENYYQEEPQSASNTEKQKSKSQASKSKSGKSKTTNNKEKAPPKRPPFNPRTNPYAPPVYIESRAGRSNNCCENPVDRLKNVDIIEELNYYPEGQEDDKMDYFSYCNDCGEYSPMGSNDCCGGNKKSPVTYCRRQRFNFKGNEEDTHCSGGPPYAFNTGFKCKGSYTRCCPCCVQEQNLCRTNSFDEIPVGKNPRIGYKDGSGNCCCGPKNMEEDCQDNGPTNNGANGNNSGGGRGCNNENYSGNAGGGGGYADGGGNAGGGGGGGSSKNKKGVVPNESGMYFYDAERKCFVKQDSNKIKPGEKVIYEELYNEPVKEVQQMIQPVIIPQQMGGFFPPPPPCPPPCCEQESSSSCTTCCPPCCCNQNNNCNPCCNPCMQNNNCCNPCGMNCMPIVMNGQMYCCNKGGNNGKGDGKYGKGKDDYYYKDGRKRRVYHGGDRETYPRYNYPYTSHHYRPPPNYPTTTGSPTYAGNTQRVEAAPVPEVAESSGQPESRKTARRSKR